MVAKQKKYSVDIDRIDSELFIINARTATEAKSKAWDKFVSKKPKKKSHRFYVDEV